MQISYDELKRASNLAKHGLDFADLDLEFFMSSMVVPARSPRLMAIGAFGESIIAVVFAPLGSEAVSIISMRHASRRERSIL